MTAFDMYCNNTNVLTESLFIFLNSFPPGTYLEETLDQPLDLSIKRASDYHDSDSNSNSSNSSDSSYGNEDRVDEESERAEDLRLYNLLRENTSINEMHLKNRNTPVLWQFLLMCLGSRQCNPSLIEWISRETATFKLTNVNALANLWGQIKKRPRMNADHFKRSLRRCYKTALDGAVDGGWHHMAIGELSSICALSEHAMGELLYASLEPLNWVENNTILRFTAKILNRLAAVKQNPED
ncbi:unnamed protein product [Hydatigera taeniaeformis]|uniref:ETS domain-containing protein n=1 Tax=Hydatigena taeniaeformis TaxID=6205 RepID=A0A0R3WN72_HYDTA|nr:unnamed protein product [Hydatigera taeniaeformis]